MRHRSRFCVAFFSIAPAAPSLEARFEGARGSGRRLERRVCNFVFERR